LEKVIAVTDTLTSEQRSKRMSLVKNKNTKPELIVRRLIHGLGFRYRLHGKGLPGKPDLVFASRRKVIFVHGCFWHRHPDFGCPFARLPKSRLDFWLPKLTRNKEHDDQVQAQLRQLGWESLVVWECQLRDMEMLTSTISEFLNGEKNEFH
jgi:DNA mismatch endonuclease (patch repair protein)